MQIVIVDDDASQRHYLAALLRRMDHEVMAAPDGETALELLRSSDAAMLVCDVDMPEMDGLTLSRTVRGLDLGRYIYVLMVTGHDRRENHVAGLEAGADDFMSKPVDASILALRVRAAERLVNYEAELQASRRWLERAYETIRQDLDAAAKAQQHLLPPLKAQISSCRFSSQFIPSSAVSGDVFGYFPVPENKVAFYAADVSGHGVRAALSAVALAHLVTPEFFWTAVSNGRLDGGGFCAAGLARALDKRFTGADDDDNYVTMFGATLNEASDELSFCQAGYPSPLMIRASGEIEWIGAGGMPVGMLPFAEFESDTVAFRRADRLLVCSDGVVEAENADGEAFGEERLADFVCRHPAARSPELVEDIAAHLRQWTGAHAFADDVSIIMIEREDDKC